MKKKYFFVGALILMFVLGNYYVVSYATQKDDAKDIKAELEKKRKVIKEKVEKLKNDKKDIVKYIEKLDKQLNVLNAQIDNSNEEIVSVKKELKSLDKKIAKAKETEKKQYDVMKKRIKYMYENGNGDYLQILLGADNVTDLLNRTEYVSKIAEYDEDILKRYRDAKQEVVNEETELKQKLEELDAFKEELAFEQDTVEQLVEDKTTELNKFEKSIKVTSSQVKNYNEKIEEQEEIIEKILEQERAEARAKDVFNKHVVTKFRRPLKVKGIITSTFGYRKAPTAGASTFHKGVDFGVKRGTPIVATAKGYVVTASYQSAAGNYVMLYHGNTIFSVYMHCSKIKVSKGDDVKAGDVIAYVGNTGVSTGPHLHFGIQVDGSYVNPLKYVSR